MNLEEYKKLKQGGQTGKCKNLISFYNGIKFDSKKEMNRYKELELLYKLGKIKDLRHQVVYKIIVNGYLVCKYIADFVYFDIEKNIEIVEDVKGFRTLHYKLKKKLMKAVYNIDIQEI